MAFPLLDILSIGSKIIDRVIPDKAAADKAKLDMMAAAQAGELQALVGQLEINKAEAGSQSVFVAGWRPFIGWICGASLVSDFIVRPMATWVAALAHHAIEYPNLDISTLMTLLLGMLGLGAMRSYDKTQGNSNGH